MDLEIGRKRPWESKDPIDSNTKRRASPTLVAYEWPPLPQHAGHYLHDSKTLNERRLPPLSAPTCSPAEPLTDSTQPLLPSRRISESRPSSQPRFASSQQLVAGQWPTGAQGRFKSPLASVLVCLQRAYRCVQVWWHLAHAAVRPPKVYNLCIT